MKTTRRKFLKKVAYTAPVIIGLGALVQPENLSAYDRERGKSKIKKTKDDYNPLP